MSMNEIFSDDEDDTKLQQSTIVGLVDTPQGIFDRLDKDLLLKHLKTLKAENTINGKLFYKTYSKWDSMSPDQRMKVFDFWANNLQADCRSSIKVQVEFDMKNETSEETNRQSVTTYNDLARLLHLKIDPSAATLWSDALREKNRLQLDDKDRHGGIVDPYDDLASLFNDPNNKYQNACAIPGALDNSGMYVPAQPGMGLLAKQCGAINPNPSGRPIRDGSWIRNKWKEIKSTLTVYFQRYMKFGNQDGEHPYDEWVKFLDNGGTGVPLIAYYSICIFTVHDFNLMGKAIPREAQMDTGLIDPDITEEDRVKTYLEKKRRESAEARKRQRAAKKQRLFDSFESEEEVSGITPSASTMSASMLNNTIGERLADFNAIEQRKLKVQEIEAENKAELDIINCALAHGDDSQRQLGSSLLSHKLEAIKKKMGL